MKSIKAINYKVIIGQLVLLFVFLITCQILVKNGVINHLYLAEPSEILKKVYLFFAKGTIFNEIYYTYCEFIIGFLIALITGISFGLVLSVSAKLYNFFSPFISALMAIPRVTIIPLLILWLGIGITQKIVTVFIFSFFPILLNTIAGTKETNKKFVYVAKVFEASKLQIVFKVLLPSALPTIFSGLRLSAANGLVGAIFGEMLGAKVGLGYQLSQAMSLYDTTKVFALIVVITAISVLDIAIIDIIEKRIRPSIEHEKV